MKKFITILMMGSSFLNAQFIPDYANDNSYWKHYNVPKTMSIGLAITALVTGNETRFGKTTYQAVDSLLMSTVTVAGMKQIFGRVRPKDREEYGGEDTWFESGNQSFPSGHVAAVTSIVVPYILEYGDENPYVHALWLLPIQQMVGRYKDEAHAQTDVLAGFGVGVLSSYAARWLDVPLLLTFTEDGVYGGISFKF